MDYMNLYLGSIVFDKNSDLLAIIIDDKDGVAKDVQVSEKDDITVYDCYKSCDRMDSVYEIVYPEELDYESEFDMPRDELLDMDRRERFTWLIQSDIKTYTVPESILYFKEDN